MKLRVDSSKESFLISLWIMVWIFTIFSSCHSERCPLQRYNLQCCLVQQKLRAVPQQRKDLATSSKEQYFIRLSTPIQKSDKSFTGALVTITRPWGAHCAHILPYTVLKSINQINDVQCVPRYIYNNSANLYCSAFTVAIQQTEGHLFLEGNSLSDSNRMNHRLRWSYPNLGYFLAFKSCIGRTKLTKATCGLGQKHLCSLPIMALAKKVYYTCSSASSLPWKGGGGFFWSPVWPSGNRSPFHMSFRTCEVENERGEGALNLENVACNYQLKYELISAQEYVRGPNQALRKKRQDEGFRGKKLPTDTTSASSAAAAYKKSLVIHYSMHVQFSNY